jgi:hypothetical protein
MENKKPLYLGKLNRRASQIILASSRLLSGSKKGEYPPPASSVEAFMIKIN